MWRQNKAVSSCVFAPQSRPCASVMPLVCPSDGADKLCAKQTWHDKVGKINQVISDGYEQRFCTGKYCSSLLPWFSDSPLYSVPNKIDFKGKELASKIGKRKSSLLNCRGEENEQTYGKPSGVLCACLLFSSSDLWELAAWPHDEQQQSLRAEFYKKINAN